ncbi:hypothetical protein BXA09_06865 [Campylobacter upsaliensis]|nr:hypothetical protein [Campylobacter upsaliensis]EAL0282292.1 hypothetical protein [Campylobacter upsaliensis]EKS7445375.1 hypothetical protein [Campylobacter upsaliensis]EMD1320561.1 hypothetical protein [Campylobacter upsaliensis]HEC1544667.1 hypothetical protein [Campylobacter upsaliensis]
MSATGKPITLSKGEERLVSLDNYNTKYYNHHNEFYGHTHHLLTGANFLPQESSPVANSYTYYIQKNVFFKIKFLFLVLLSSLTLAHANKEAQNIIDSASEGRRVVEEKALSPIDINKDKEKLFYSETILNWHYVLQKENPRGAETIAKTEANLFVKNLKEENLNKDNNLTQAEEQVAVKGYCFIREEINVGKQPSSLRLECSTNVGSIVMFANLVNLNEKASLIVDPKYIEKSGVRFEVKSSIVTNEEKTSYNIATYVNDRMLAKVGYGALSVGSDEVKNASNEYLKALEESKKKQEVNYVNVPDGQGGMYPQAVQNTNTEKPDPLDYLVKGAINVGASAVKAFADLAKEDLPYLYQIVPKTKIWIDLKVNKQGEYVK